MRAILQMLPGVALCIVLATGGDWLVARFGLPVPGAVIGMVAYALWLSSGRGIGWSIAGARLLIGWIGAMIVPALVALQRLAAVVSWEAAGILALLLVATTLVTALVTALLFRLAGGRG